MAVIDPGTEAAALLQAVLDAAGGNFTAPYDSGTQPHDVAEANSDDTVSFQFPGGTETEGKAHPAQGGDMGTVINTLLIILSPFISAYSLLLPILGIIRGIIEIICCFGNPFCLVPAIIRLFEKWIPPFISLFPPSAGIVLLLSVIKLLIGIVFFIQTELIPTIELIIKNIERLTTIFDTPDDVAQATLDAAEAKFESVLETLIQKMGILKVAGPILELIFLILRLVAGFPCEGGNQEEANRTIGVTFDSPVAFAAIEDTSCCNDEICPPLISFRDQAPRGPGVMFVTSFGDCAPGFVFQVATINQEIAELGQFQESLEEQLACLLDEPVNYARPPGSTLGRSLFKVRITGRRGSALEIIVPVLSFSGTSFKITSPLGPLFIGTIDYEILPDYDMLVMQGILSLGCHPDVSNAKNAVADLYDLNTSVLDKNPESATLLEEYNVVVDRIVGPNGFLIGDPSVALIGKEGDVQSSVRDCISRIDVPPFEDDIQCLEDVRDAMLDLTNDFLDSLNDKLNSLVNRSVDGNNSLFEVDKNVAIADGQDFATIIVTPRDIAGVFLIKNLPVSSLAAVTLDLFTDFGTIGPQTVNNENGTITAPITSIQPGAANITARISGVPLIDFVNLTTTTAVRTVNFVSEAVLPARRRKSKASGSVLEVGATSERGPSNK